MLYIYTHIYASIGVGGFSVHGSRQVSLTFQDGITQVVPKGWIQAVATRWTGQRDDFAREKEITPEGKRLSRGPDRSQTWLVTVIRCIYIYICWAPPRRAHLLDRRVLKSADAENGGDRRRDCK